MKSKAYTTTTKTNVNSLIVVNVGNNTDAVGGDKAEAVDHELSQGLLYDDEGNPVQIEEGKNTNKTKEDDNEGQFDGKSMTNLPPQGLLYDDEGFLVEPEGASNHNLVKEHKEDDANNVLNELAITTTDSTTIDEDGFIVHGATDAIEIEGVNDYTGYVSPASSTNGADDFLLHLEGKKDNEGVEAVLVKDDESDGEGEATNHRHQPKVLLDIGNANDDGIDNGARKEEEVSIRVNQRMDESDDELAVVSDLTATADDNDTAKLCNLVACVVDEQNNDSANQEGKEHVIKVVLGSPESVLEPITELKRHEISEVTSINDAPLADGTVPAGNLCNKDDKDPCNANNVEDSIENKDELVKKEKKVVVIPTASPKESRDDDAVCDELANVEEEREAVASDSLKESRDDDGDSYGITDIEEEREEVATASSKELRNDTNCCNENCGMEAEANFSIDPVTSRVDNHDKVVADVGDCKGAEDKEREHEFFSPVDSALASVRNVCVTDVATDYKKSNVSPDQNTSNVFDDRDVIIKRCDSGKTNTDEERVDVINNISNENEDNRKNEKETTDEEKCEQVFPPSPLDSALASVRNACVTDIKAIYKNPVTRIDHNDSDDVEIGGGEDSGNGKDSTQAEEEEEPDKNLPPPDSALASIRTACDDSPLNDTTKGKRRVALSPRQKKMLSQHHREQQRQAKGRTAYNSRLQRHQFTFKQENAASSSDEVRWKRRAMSRLVNAEAKEQNDNDCIGGTNVGKGNNAFPDDAISAEARKIERRKRILSSRSRFTIAKEGDDQSSSNKPAVPKGRGFRVSKFHDTVYANKKDPNQNEQHHPDQEPVAEKATSSRNNTLQAPNRNKKSVLFNARYQRAAEKARKR